MSLMTYQMIKKIRRPRDFVRWEGLLHEVKERDGVHCSTKCGRYARGETVTDQERRKLGRTCTRCYKGTDIIEGGRDDGKPTPLALDMSSQLSKIANLGPKSHLRRKF